MEFALKIHIMEKSLFSSEAAVSFLYYQGGYSERDARMVSTVFMRKFGIDSVIMIF
jgi:hypothetical protein